MLHPLQLLVTGVSLLVVLYSGLNLPESVASHFDSTGRPDAYMPRTAFLWVSTLVVCGVPQLVMWLVPRSVRRPGFRLPNASHWLSPERIGQTERYMERWATAIGAVLAAFLLFCHLQVILANRMASSPTLEPRMMAVLGALALLISAIFVAVAIASHHFRRV